MKALKIRLYQETVCYKKPYAFKVTETYPLPPYSTVIGMLHGIIGAGKDEYHQMEISVQGKYEGIFTTYNTTRFYNGDNITSMPLNVHMLYGVSLIIHVVSDDDTLNKIYEGFKTTGTAFTLGRREDLARLDDIKFVELNKLEKENEFDDDQVVKLKYSIYVPDKYKTSLRGIGYKINKVYKIINDLRKWEKIRVKYVECDALLDNGEYYIDNDSIEEDIAFLA